MDKNPSYPPATEQLKKSNILPDDTELGQVKYLNNTVEQDHRGVIHLINPGMSFGSFNSARRTIKGYEAMNMIRKGQINNVKEGYIIRQISFINQIFGLAA